MSGRLRCALAAFAVVGALLTTMVGAQAQGSGFTASVEKSELDAALSRADGVIRLIDDLSGADDEFGEPASPITILLRNPCGKGAEMLQELRTLADRAQANSQFTTLNRIDRYAEDLIDALSYLDCGPPTDGSPARLLIAGIHPIISLDFGLAGYSSDIAATSSLGVSGHSSQSSTGTSLGGDIGFDALITDKVALTAGVWFRRVIDGGESKHAFNVDPISVGDNPDFWVTVKNSGFTMPHAGVKLAVPTISDWLDDGRPDYVNPAWLSFYYGRRFDHISGSTRADQNGIVTYQEFSQTLQGDTFGVELLYPLRSGGADVSLIGSKNSYARIGLAYDTYKSLDVHHAAEFGFNIDTSIKFKDNLRAYMGVELQY